MAITQQLLDSVQSGATTQTDLRQLLERGDITLVEFTSLLRNAQPGAVSSVPLPQFQNPNAPSVPSVSLPQFPSKVSGPSVGPGGGVAATDETGDSSSGGIFPKVNPPVFLPGPSIPPTITGDPTDPTQIPTISIPGLPTTPGGPVAPPPGGGAGGGGGVVTNPALPVDQGGQGIPTTEIGGGTGADILAGLQGVLTSDEQQILDSITRGGRRGLFNQFLAGQPQVSQAAQFGQQQAFNPLSASFILNNLINPASVNPEGQGAVAPGEGLFGANFLSALQGGIAKPTGADFNSLLAQLSGQLGPGAFGQGNPSQVTQTNLLSQEPTAQNIIQSGFAAQFNPLLQLAARQSALQQIQQFQGQDATTPIFQAFLQGLMGGGQGFFGGF